MGRPVGKRHRKRLIFLASPRFQRTRFSKGERLNLAGGKEEQKRNVSACNP